MSQSEESVQNFGDMSIELIAAMKESFETAQE
jgi:hypothetical protein